MVRFQDAEVAHILAVIGKPLDPIEMIAASKCGTLAEAGGEPDEATPITQDIGRTPMTAVLERLDELDKEHRVDPSTYAEDAIRHKWKFLDDWDSPEYDLQKAV